MPSSTSSTGGEAETQAVLNGSTPYSTTKAESHIQPFFSPVQMQTSFYGGARGKSLNGGEE